MTDLDKTITEMLEYVCDNLCRYPEMESEEESLEEPCGDCRMGEFINAVRSCRTNEMEK